jgi:hypothetical protein
MRGFFFIVYIDYIQNYISYIQNYISYIQNYISYIQNYISYIQKCIAENRYILFLQTTGILPRNL